MTKHALILTLIAFACTSVLTDDWKPAGAINEKNEKDRHNSLGIILWA